LRGSELATRFPSQIKFNTESEGKQYDDSGNYSNYCWSFYSSHHYGIKTREEMNMPKGSPNTQTKATDKYQAKITVKGFKIRKSLADEFAAACEKAGVGQAATISRLMQEFIDQQKGTANGEG